MITEIVFLKTLEHLNMIIKFRIWYVVNCFWDTNHLTFIVIVLMYTNMNIGFIYMMIVCVC